MKKSIYTIIAIIFSSFGVFSQANSLNSINKCVEKINNSSKLKTTSFDVKKKYESKEEISEVVKINGKIKKIIIELHEYAYDKKTIIYLHKKTPILISKEIRGERTAYLTNGDIITTILISQTDFYVINWQK